eukprot:GILK01002243.1.p1 GENE.GILK01002243.1~~GILK01002243.1.p1  ORF type:complete len:519 (-),score=94.16 GILK01002243.1:134-1594(-)
MATVKADPWSTIPIRNQKYAFEATEMHLGEQGIEELVHFENFPNLEVIWLNGNKLTRVTGLDTNFRIKCLYVQNNRLISLKGSLKNFKFLQVLFAGGNQLRDLDANLKFLSRFSFLTHLDLSGNPLSEEPDYRLKVVASIPSLQVFDRHAVTELEREQAVQFMKRESQSDPSTMVVPPAHPSRHRQGSINKPNSNKKKKKVWQELSAGEKDLFREVGRVRLKMEEQEHRKLEQVYQESMRGATNPIPFNTLPLNKTVLETSQRISRRDSEHLNEWEKNELRPIFDKYDKTKTEKARKYQISIEDASNALITDLFRDESCIGKIPVHTELDVRSVLESIQKANAAFLNLPEFRRFISELGWRTLDQQTLQERIDNHYKLAKKYEQLNDITKVKTETTKALRLEGVKDQHLEMSKTVQSVQNPQSADVFTAFTYESRTSNEKWDTSKPLTASFRVDTLSLKEFERRHERKVLTRAALSIVARESTSPK